MGNSKADWLPCYMKSMVRAYPKPKMFKHGDLDQPLLVTWRVGLEPTLSLRRMSIGTLINPFSLHGE